MAHHSGAFPTKEEAGLNDRYDHDMAHVLRHHAALGPKPIETLTPDEARRQPTVADAVRQVLIEKGKNPDDDLGIDAQDIEIDGAAGALQARVYRPRAKMGEILPVVVYFHGGGWVFADLDVYDATPRGMAKAAECLFISCHYRQAPEHKFPAAHDDAFAAYKWTLANISRYGGDPTRVAVMGESAGGNLAANVAIAARDQGAPAPAHMALIYPVAGADMNNASYAENVNAKPLNRPAMQWFVDHVFDNPSQTKDPRIDLVNANLANLPSATVIRAEIDPLCTEGDLLVERLKAAGGQVRGDVYKGAAHEFFGMGLVVSDAQIAEMFVAHELKRAFGTAMLPV